MTLGNGKFVVFDQESSVANMFARTEIVYLKQVEVKARFTLFDYDITCFMLLFLHCIYHLTVAVDLQEREAY